MCPRLARASSCFLSSLASATSPFALPFPAATAAAHPPRPLSPRWFLGHARVVCVLAPPRECAGVCTEIDLFSSLRVLLADGSRKHEKWSRNEDSAHANRPVSPGCRGPSPSNSPLPPSNMLCAGRTPDGEGGKWDPAEPDELRARIPEEGTRSSTLTVPPSTSLALTPPLSSFFTFILSLWHGQRRQLSFLSLSFSFSLTVCACLFCFVCGPGSELRTNTGALPPLCPPQ